MKQHNTSYLTQHVYTQWNDSKLKIRETKMST